MVDGLGEIGIEFFKRGDDMETEGVAGELIGKIASIDLVGDGVFF